MNPLYILAFSNPDYDFSRYGSSSIPRDADDPFESLDEKPLISRETWLRRKLQKLQMFFG